MKCNTERLCWAGLYLDNTAGSKIKVLLDNLHELLSGLGPGAVVEHGDGEWLGHSNGVGDLHQAPSAQPGGHEALGHPPGGVGGTPVHLGGVLAREGPASVSAPPAVGVHDDLPAGQPGVTHRAADDEVPTRVDVVLGLLVEVLLGDGRVDDLLHDVLPEGLEGDFLAVLAGHHDGVDPDGDAGSVLKLVLGGDLGLAVRAGPPQGPVTSQLGDLPAVTQLSLRRLFNL